MVQRLLAIRPRCRGHRCGGPAVLAGWSPVASGIGGSTFVVHDVYFWRAEFLAQ